MSKKIQVLFSDKQVDLLENFKGELGDSDSEVVRSIVISWLAEKSFISTMAKQKISTNAQLSNLENKGD